MSEAKGVEMSAAYFLDRSNSGNGATNVFHDFPYLPPIEASAYYSALDSAKLYPLPESTMAPLDSPGYLFSFAGSGAACSKLAPSLLSHVEGLAPIFPLWESCMGGDTLCSYVTICTSSAEQVVKRLEGGGAAPRVLRFSSVDGGDGVNKFLQSLFLALRDALPGDTKQQPSAVPVPVPTVLLLDHVMCAVLFGTAEEQFALSLLLTGIASLLHAFHSPSAPLVKPVQVIIATGGNELSAPSPLAGLVAAKLHMFFDTVRIPPAVVESGDIVAAGLPTDDRARGEIPPLAKVLDQMATTLVDLHEDLCERIEDGEYDGKEVPVVVVVTGNNDDATVLQRACLSRYSPIPMQFSLGAVRSWAVENFHPSKASNNSSKNAPLMILLPCAVYSHGIHIASMLKDQSIAAVVHAGMNADGAFFSREHLSILRQPWGKKFQVPRCVEENVVPASLCRADVQKVRNGGDVFAVAQMGHTLLGFLRCFANSPTTRINLSLLPVLTAEQLHPVRQWVTDALTYLANGKCIDVTQDDTRGGNVYHVRLLPFGRLASRRWRLMLAEGNEKGPAPPLRLEALRCLLWSTLFRATRGEVESILLSLYASFPSAACPKQDDNADEDSSLPKAVLSSLLDNFPELSSFGQGAVHRSLLRLSLVLGSWPVVCAPSVRVMEGVPFGRAEMAMCVPSGRRQRFEPAERRPITCCRGWWGTAPVDTEKIFAPAPPAPAMNFPSARDLCVIATASSCDDISKSATQVATLPTLMSDALLATRISLHTAFNNLCMLLEAPQFQTRAEGSPIPPEAPSLPQLPLVLLSSPSFLTFADPSVSTTVQDGHGFVANSGAWLDYYVSHASGPVGFDLSLASLSRQSVSHLEVCKHRLFASRTRSLDDDDDGDGGGDDNELSPASKKIRTEQNAVTKKVTAPAVFTGTVPSGKEKQIIDEFITVCGKIGRELAESKYTGKKGFAFLASGHPMNPYYEFHVSKKGQ